MAPTVHSVAPVRIGEGAIVGAGSVITRDVEPDSLAIERSEQKGLAGWARLFRERVQDEESCRLNVRNCR